MICHFCGTELPAGALFCVECGRPVGQVEIPIGARVTSTPPAVVRPDAARASVTTPVPERTPEPELDVRSDPKPVSIPPPGPAPAETARFVLQFSTGESVVVEGTGLIGRNPAAEPGEYVDQLVAVFDVGKSVSKSHIEFGQQDGRFWVADRYSTNGTLVIRPGDRVIRCDPGKRYVIERGARIEMGDQFFVLS